jgi:hypothetical protein
MIRGLEAAGPNPTHASFITNLHKVATYDIGGLTPSSWGFTNFGTVKMIPKTACGWFFQLVGDKFVTGNNGKPYCGSYIESPVTG